MNMRRVLFNRKTLLSGICLVGTLGAVRYALIPAEVMVIFDQKIAPDMQGEMRKIIEKAPLRSLGAKGLCEQLQKNYHAVQSVTLSYQSSLRAQVLIKAHVPHIAIVSALSGNKEYILYKIEQKGMIQDASQEQGVRAWHGHGSLIEKKYYSSQVTDSLPTLIVDGDDYEDKKTHPEFLECASQLKSALFEDYSVTWKSKSEIILQSRQANIILIADIITIHDAKRLTHVEHIFASDGARYKKGLKADIRLRESIVCAPL